MISPCYKSSHETNRDFEKIWNLEVEPRGKMDNPEKVALKSDQRRED